VPGGSQVRAARDLDPLARDPPGVRREQHRDGGADVVRKPDPAKRDRDAIIWLSCLGSRVSSRQLASGERLGRDTADAGAEAAELERWSVYTIGIGGHAPSEGDWSAVDLSIGKGRIGGGDMVYPGRYCGRTGAWRLAGVPRPAAEVKAEREGNQASAKQP
jgi:hypothetical protein